MRNLRTICSKHDRIADLANISNSNEDLNDLRDRLSEIYDIVRDAKVDGEKMEAGLDKKRKRIEELEKEENRLLMEIENLKNQIER